MRMLIKGLKMSGALRMIAALAIILSFHISAADASEAYDVKSRAAVVMEAETGRVLYAKNPDTRLLPASTTKLMTALVVVEKAKLSDVVTVSKRAVNVAPTKSGLKAGDQVTIENLLYAALMKSANDAAVALAEAVSGSEQEFVVLMNRKAASIGAEDTHFVNANGLPAKGQYITAYDLAKIMRQAMKYPVLKAIIGTRITELSTENGKQIPLKNTNKLLWSDEELLGGKTGYTRKARHCFVCAGERDKETIIVALLGAPSRDLLWKETEDLMAFGSRVLNNTQEPVIYFAGSVGSSGITRASYTESDDDPGIRPHSKKKYRAGKSKAVKVATARKKHSGRLAHRKKARTNVARSKKAKRPNIAQKTDNGNQG